MSEINYVSEDSKPSGITVDDSNCVDEKLPPYPQPLRKPDPQVDPPQYQGELDDLKHRIRYKLLLLWFFYAKIRFNHKLETILAKPTEDHSSDEYLVKSCVVDILDELAKILIVTNLLEELKFLFSD